MYVIDLLLSALSQQNDEEGDGPANGHSHVLLTKKRALRSSTSKLIAEPLAHQAKHYEMPPVCERAVLTPTAFDNDP